MEAKNGHGILVVTMATLLSLSALTAKADQASSTVSVFAGLAPVMTLDCTPVNFGVYNVPRGNREMGVNSSSASITTSVNPSDGTSQTSVEFANAGVDKISLSVNTEHAPPQAGTCTVKGSRVQNGTLSITRDPIHATPITFSGEGSNMFASGLRAPEILASGMTALLAVPKSVLTDSEGGAVFAITGQVSIPNDLTSDNYGSYNGAALTITVSETP
jgi:hypothetical protein